MNHTPIRQVSVVIPVYKTSTTLFELVERILPVLTAQKCDFEIIFVDDGGVDESWAALTELHTKFDFVRVFRLSRNYGQHNAILFGTLQAKGDIIITMDDDLQHPPEVLPQLFDALTADVDVVYGSPKSGRHGFFRNVSSRLTKMVLQGVMGTENAQHVSALRIFRQKLVVSWRDLKSPLVNMDVLLTWVTDRFAYVLVDHHERKMGNSGYTFIKLLSHALNLVTGFSRLPLQIASIVGIMFAGFGFLIFLYVFIMWLTHEDSVPGFAFLASIISIFAGIQLISIGIMGEYISRMFDKVSERPRFVVRDSLSDHSKR